MLWLALNIFCASCWGLRGDHNGETKKALRVNLNRSDKTLKTHTHSLAKLFPALEEVVWGHFSWLEELVDGDWQLEGQVLQSATIPEEKKHTGYFLTTSVILIISVVPTSVFQVFLILIKTCFFSWVQGTVWFLRDKRKCTGVSCHVYIGDWCVCFCTSINSSRLW